MIITIIIIIIIMIIMIIIIIIIMIIIIIIMIIIIIIIIIRGVSGPAPEWRGVSRSRGSPGDGFRAGVGAQRRKKGDGKYWI